ncbi:MAG: 50S ribosomal protein L35 [bacterium]
MPKMKTHRGAAKRFRKTGGGKIVHKRSGMSHLLYGKTKKRKRRLKHKSEITGANLRNIRSARP